MTTERPAFRRPLDYWLLWLLVLSSLALNGALIYALLLARAEAARTATEAAEVFSQLQAVTIETTLKVDDAVPVEGTIPFQTNLQIPIDTRVPINTVVNVPIDFPIIGTRNFRVPINTSVPIQLTVDVPIDFEVPIVMSVPVQLEVPLYIAFSETELGPALERAETLMRNLSDKLTSTPE